MLTSCKLTGSPQAVSAYHAKNENYYFSQASGVEAISGEPSSQGHIRVYGKLCPALGLTSGGSISQEAFTNILSGRDASGRRLAREHKVHGIDLVFSAPKTVSIAGLLTERDSRIVAAHDRAVLETMAEIEAHCSGSRVWPRGEEVPVKTDNLAYVAVRDGFNRDHDPHLHTHVVVMNLTEHKGQLLSLDGRRIMRQDFNKAWGAMYRAKLAANLKELGYSVSYTKKGELRLDCVSLQVEREFSGRRAEILAQKEKGVRDMAAWRATREDKDPNIEKEAVLASWQERLSRHQAKTVEQNRAEAVAEREAWFKEAHWSVEARQELG
ncbi:MAG: MobF family relaxase, partial [Elusimicrobia bacterium]|nr:MobF family relaxase [Elusimicrobiota bacterium]